MNSSKMKTARTLAEANLPKALEELANLRDDPVDFERFVVRWPEFAPQDAFAEAGLMDQTTIPKRFWTLRRRREALREIWRGSSLTLSELLLPNEPPEELRDREEYLARDDETGQVVGPIWPPQVNVDWQRGQFIYQPRTEFQKSLYQLFRQSSRAKVCGNPSCPAPYFIANKATQRYCSDSCAQVYQQQWKRNWWSEHGTEWRRSRRRLKSKRRK